VVHGNGEGRATALAYDSAQQAIDDAGLPGRLVSRMAVCVGTTMSEAFNGVNSRFTSVQVNGRHPRPNTFSSIVMNHIAHHLAKQLEMEGQAVTIPTACAAGNYAIAYGRDLIVRGKARLVLVGGTDAFSRIAFIGFARLQAMSPDVCRPFDRNRQGLLLSEGSAFLILEDAEHARMRGAQIYAEILGCGLSCDGYHIAAPHPRGVGAAIAMQRALQQARLATDDVDYINAHGTGTLANDRMETAAIKRVFGKDAAHIPISSIKAVLGHAMGAASAIEAVASCLAILHKTLPPTWHYEEPDSTCDLDYVPHRPRRMRRLNVILSNSFAFGGNNACLAIGRYRH
jgi:3-oxoacyl-[acyl-carrier-protein] synthase II